MAVCNVHYRKLSWFERNAPALLTGVAFLAIIALAAILRFWQLGVRTFTNDEGLYSLVARQFANGAGYEHVPELHGPLQIMATAGVFKAFGDTDVTARVMPALFGVMLAALPFLFRHQIGRPGAIAAALLLTISPSMVYYSRSAGPDIYLAFFSLATAMIIWRYLVEPSRAWLYLLAITLAFAVATSEMALLVLPIFAIYLNYRVARALFAQAGEPRVANQALTHYDRLGITQQTTIREIRLAYKRAIDRTDSRPEREAMANAYHVLTTANRREAYDRRLAQQARIAAEQTEEITPGFATKIALAGSAWLIALLWPFAGFVRRRMNFRTLPDAAHPLIAMTLLTLPFYGPLVQKLPFVGDRGFDTQRTIIVIGGTNIVPGGEPPIMFATLGALFAIAAVLGFAWKWHAWVISWAAFYGVVITLFTGFFSNRGGVWSGIWGSLDYTWRPETRHADGPVYYYGMMLPSYEFLPLAVAALGALSLVAIGGWRNRIIMLAAAAAIAAITFAPSWAPGVSGGSGVLLAAIVAGAAVLALRLPDLTKFFAFWAVAALAAFTLIGRKDPWLTVHVALPMIMLAAKLVNDAVVAFELPEITVPQFRVYAPRRLAQGFVAAAVAVLAVFTLRTGVLAGWGHGDVPQLSGALAPRDHGDTPIELLTAQENAPDVRELAVAINAAATESGAGTSMPIAIDGSYGFSQGWAWYLRNYSNVTTADMRQPYQAAPDAVVLVDSRNRFHVQGDETSLAVTFTNTWILPNRFQPLSRDEITSRLASTAAWSDWYDYLSDRTQIDQPGYIEGVVYFPRALAASVRLARQSDVLSTNVVPPAAPAAGEELVPAP